MTGAAERCPAPRATRGNMKGDGTNMALWQKPEPDRPFPSPAAEVPHAATPAVPREHRMEKFVNIGQSITIKGELTGNEDLTIDGKVDGKIMLKDHNLTIGANGRITAEVHAKTVVVIGEVMGNVTADDKVEVAPSGSVTGDLRAPRVVLADGARFKGSIDMEVKPRAVSSGLGAPMAVEAVRAAASVKGAVES